MAISLIRPKPPSPSESDCGCHHDAHDDIWQDIKSTHMAIHSALARIGSDEVPYDRMHLVDKKVNLNGTSLSINQLLDRPSFITCVWAVFPANSNGGVLTIGTDAIPLISQNNVMQDLQMIVGANEFFSLTTPTNVSGLYYLRVMGYAMKTVGWMVDR